MPRPASADMRCSTVLTRSPSFIRQLDRRVSPTRSARAGISSGDARSTRRKTMPVSAGAGRSLIMTFWPVCKPTPEAAISDLRVRCFSMLQCKILTAFGLLLLGIDLLSHVVDDAEPRRPARKLQIERDHLHMDQVAVLLAVAPDPLAVIGAAVLEGLAQPGDVLERPDLVGGHAAEFFARVSVQAERRAIDGEEGERLGVDDPHRLRMHLEQQAVALLA